MRRRNMRVVVTGSTGQVATALLERGSLCGVTVISVGRPRMDLGNLGNLESLLSEVKPDVVVNAAAYTDVDGAELERQKAMLLNAKAAGDVAAAARLVGASIVQVSTDYVFDGEKTTPYVETDLPRPLSVYGASKLEGEVAVARANSDHAILRTSWVYSCSGKNFLKTMLKLACRSEVEVVDDQKGSPTYANDLAVAILGVAQNLRSAPARDDLRGIFHASSSGDATWAEFAEEIFQHLRDRNQQTPKVRRITTVEYKARAQRPANSRLDCSKLRNSHGIILPSWRDGLARCFETMMRIEKQ